MWQTRTALPAGRPHGRYEPAVVEPEPTASRRTASSVHSWNDSCRRNDGRSQPRAPWHARVGSPTWVSRKRPAPKALPVRGLMDLQMNRRSRRARGRRCLRAALGVASSTVQWRDPSGSADFGARSESAGGGSGNKPELDRVFNGLSREFATDACARTKAVVNDRCAASRRARTRVHAVQLLEAVQELIDAVVRGRGAARPREAALLEDTDRPDVVRRDERV